MASTDTDRTTHPSAGMTDDDLDLLARYLMLRLNIAVETNDRYSRATKAQVRTWQKQLEQTEKELIANGLAVKI